MQEKSIKGKLLPIKNRTTRTIYQEEQEGKMGKTASVKIMNDKFDTIFNHEYLGGYKFRLRPSLQRQAYRSVTNYLLPHQKKEKDKAREEREEERQRKNNFGKFLFSNFSQRSTLINKFKHYQVHLRTKEAPLLSVDSIFYFQNMPFLSSKNSHFQNEAKCKTFP